MKSVSRALALALVAAFVSACSGGGGGAPGPIGRVPTPSPSSTGTAPTPTPSSTAVSQSAFTCPTSDTAASSSRGPANALGDARTRRALAGSRNASEMPGRLEVTYDLAATSGSNARTALAARETSLGAALVGELDYTHLGIATRILNVAPAQSASIAAKMRLQAGVKSVIVGGSRRGKQAVTTPYYTNDPYFTGFSTTVPPTATSTSPPATFETAPYSESASVPGQWNMHAIGLEKAFGYSQPGNGSNVTNANALGSSGVKIAVIDVGEDTTHPELASKIAYQKCFITNPTTGVQSVSSFTTDEDGHGTDVAGIAAAASNNRLGFAGSGGASSIYGYRVQATPDDNCTSSTTTDLQCSTDTNDIASAITDAVAQNVNVITISLGGGSCNSNGSDSDSIEGNAIANAVAANIVVVAAAGNDGTSPLEAPACDTGVIAAGATALADGQPNGANNSSGSATTPVEYVASYSDYGSPGAAVRSSSAWGIVAPGGDPNGDMDGDDLHWIEDIWTSTPFMASASDTSFAGSCAPDYPGTGSQTTDCRTLIAGTSMAAPTVAGAAALIIAAAPTYQSPAKMKSLLCSTADDIGDAKEGCGRLNVYRAMAVALGDSTPP